MLKIAPCTFDAARYAVLNWHYSKVMPVGKLVKFGVWEEERFIGAVIFGRGANNNLGKSYGLQQTQICELVRVALQKGHKTPTSRIVSICLKLLKKTNKGLRMVVSYTDTARGHLGKIYQAGNWDYVGFSVATRVIDPSTGKSGHQRSVSSKYGSIKGMETVKAAPKLKYLYLFDGKLRSQIKTKQYPKDLAAIV